MNFYMKSIVKRFTRFFHYLSGKERSPRVLALSFCVGFYIAFSPFPGFHTWMVFASAWFFSLNLGVIFAVSCAINNPWTMMPVYVIDYLFGELLLGRILHLNVGSWNPSWMGTLNTWLASYIGQSNISLWSFLIGGNILGIGGAVILYPIVKRLFVRLQHKAPVKPLEER